MQRQRVRISLLTLALMLLSTILSTALAPGQVQAGSIDPNAVQLVLQSTYSGGSSLAGAKCANVYVLNRQYPNGQRVNSYDCANWDEGQAWILRSDNLIQLAGTNKCLNTWNNRVPNGTSVTLWTCTPGDSGQTWEKEFLWGFPHTIRLANSNLCLDSPLPRTNGQGLVVWSCSGNINQLWNISLMGSYYSH